MSSYHCPAKTVPVCPDLYTKLHIIEGMIVHHNSLIPQFLLWVSGVAPDSLMMPTITPSSTQVEIAMGSSRILQRFTVRRSPTDKHLHQIGVSALDLLRRALIVL